MATKKTIKENPITTFRKNFENRSKIVKASLKKAQDGIIAGPQTEMQSKLSDAMNAQPAIPRPNRPSYLDSVNPYNPQNNIRIANDQYKKALLNRTPKEILGKKPTGFKKVVKPNNGPGSGMGRMAADDAAFDAIMKKEYKKGGATKAAKFAALAKPFNKATAADRIAGAKKNARKK